MTACPGGARADSVVDVSREWKDHASTAPAAIHLSTAAAEVRGLPSSEAPNACECEPLSTPEKLEQCTYAFTGQVLEVDTPKKGRRTLAFDVDEIFKGSPKQEMEVVEDVDGTDCDLPFKEGQTYLIYARWEWGSAVTSRCMGSKLIEQLNGEGLGPSQALKEKLYIHLRNACMGRIDTPCCLSSLKALRAGYHIPEPDGGCPAGMVPDRLRCAGSYTWCITDTEKDHSQPGH